MEPFLATAKIMIFGEYSVLTGSNALLTPYSKFSGQLKISDIDGLQIAQEPKSTEILGNLINYLKELGSQNKLLVPINFEAFQQDIDNGLYFHSTIPQQYGLGSSGALTAAVFRQYSNKIITNLAELKTGLAQMESFFHGKSSGVDSLVSYLQKPVLIDNSKIIPIDFSFKDKAKKFGIFMVNSGQSSATKDSVNTFMNQFNTNDETRGIILNRYNPLLQKIIDSFITKEPEAFYSLLKQFAQLHFKLFGHLFTEKIRPIAQVGMETDLFCLKLCGSGNGGYYLGFTKEIKETEKHFRSYGFEIIMP